MAVSLTEYKVPPTGNFDNQADAYRCITVSPLASSMGAEISGVDLSRLDDARFSEIEAALYRHKMLYFRNQSLSFSDQENFTRRFGEFGKDAYTSGVEGHRNIQRVVKEADEKLPMVFGGTWHTDSPFLQKPPCISMLYGVEVPPYGGDTWWANTALAYDFLSDTMKSVLQSLRVHMSARNIVSALQRKHSETGAMTAVADELPEQDMMIRGSYHPLVRTHPVTGRRSLYVDQSYSMGIEGMTETESSALIGFLIEHITQPVFTCRLRWENNMLVIWENRTTIHHAFNDYDGFRREMYRTIVEGEVPA